MLEFSLKHGQSALSLMLLATFASRSFGDEHSKNRLLTEAPKSWAALEVFGAQLEGSFTAVEEELKFSDGSNRPKMRVQCDFLVNGKWALVKIRGQPMGTKQSLNIDWVKGVNSRYAFTLERDSDSMPYKPDWLGSPRDTYIQSEMVGDVYKYVYAPWWFGKPLSNWLGLSGFVVKDAASVRTDNKEYVRMDYEYAPDPTALKRKRLSGTSRGSILLDPHNFWCIQKYEESMEWGKISGSLEYGDKIDGFPGVRRKTHLIHNNNGSESKEVLEFQRIARREAPEKEFTLSAFGVDEPAAFESVNETSHAWRWFALAIVLIVAVVVAIRWYQYRVRARSTLQIPS